MARTMAENMPSCLEQYSIDTWNEYVRAEVEKTVFMKEVVLKGLKQKDVAEKLNISQDAVSRYKIIEEDLIMLRAHLDKISVPKKYRYQFYATLTELSKKYEKFGSIANMEQVLTERISKVYDKLNNPEKQSKKVEKKKTVKSKPTQNDEKER